MDNYELMSEPIICLPAEKLASLNLMSDQRISVHLGFTRFHSQVQEADGSNDCPSLLLGGHKGSGLLPETQVHLAKTNRGLELGPLLGILCSGGPAELYWTDLELARYIIQLGHKLGMVAYLVTPDSLDLDRKQAYGYSIKETDNTWYMEPIPLPTVFYNRVYTLSNPQAVNKYYLLLALAARNELMVYNCSGLDKWVLYQLLKGEGQLPVNIPNTQPYAWPHVNEFIQQYPFVYLKPRSASLSKGLIRIRDQSGQYLCEYYDDTTEKKQILAHDSVEIAALMEPNQDYLVQQGIALASIGDRPVDFRVHVHKDREGVWQLVYVAGRLGGVHQVSTRPRFGGSREPAPALLTRLFPEQEREYIQRLTVAALALAQRLEKKIDSSLGELAFDLGFDGQGQLWLFEANERPSAYHLLQVVPGAYQRLVTLILQYCHYLSGLSNQPFTRLMVRNNDSVCT